MGVRGLVIPADHRIEVHLRSLTFEDMQTVVGGTVQLIPQPVSGLCLLANEDGAMLRLPTNERASDLWARLRGHGPGAAGTLVGDVVLVGDAADDFGDLDLALAKRYLPFPFESPREV